MTGGEDQSRRLGGFDAAGRRWVLGVFGAGGALAGIVLPYLAGLAADLPWFPFQGPLQLLGSFDQAWLVWLRPAVGLALGLAFAIWVIHESPVLHLTSREIRVERRGEVQRVIARDKVDAVFRRRSNVVIQTASGRELFDDDVEGDRDEVRDAFVALGYPWEGPPG
ncbi:YqeB family protein [Oceanitalea stevensii]|uniref:YqeB PH domain-containing protein n=1 Tax=Oceanitalea stevensii TaxID=2763072 RepID=A0ABR8Z558_9MICO|nr:hypothetical protein [Oceanitalea stevensii]MBD8063455.1 hypothetical protein [Oceanitalea stevensii]